jgi:phosphatidylglycerol:prolipoprotein diacylglycerol transferase
VAKIAPIPAFPHFQEREIWEGAVHSAYGIIYLMNPFSIWVGLGASLGLWQVRQHVPLWQAPRWMNAALFTLAGALLGARLWFVLFNLHHYRLHPLETLYIWQGGYDWPGGILGALLVMLLVARRWPISLARLSDVMAALIPPLAIAAWLGCWQTGCAYGLTPASPAWWAVPCRDETGGILGRLPVQLIAVLCLVGYYAWLESRFSSRRPAGQHASLAFLGLTLNLFAFSFLRADPVPLWAGVRPDSWLSGALLLLSIAAALLTFLRPQPVPLQTSVIPM